MRRLLIRPGAIGDFIVSLPALEALRSDYTEVWCAGQNVPLVRWAHHAQSIVSSGLDRIGHLNSEDVVERLRRFDSIISWYGANNEDFREFVHDLPFRFLPSLPDGTCHAVEFYNRQAEFLVPGVAPARFPYIACAPRVRNFAALHPFSSSVRKSAPVELFEAVASRLSETMPVHWLCGPEEFRQGATRIDDLYELACWLSGARIFIGNDSGISHLAAAVGTPVVAFFRTTDANTWTPRGPAVLTADATFSL